MIIKSAIHVSSGVSLKDYPKDDKPEYAVIGRSNVGKSSLINLLCDNSKLARVSKTPGKTITINHFLFNEIWYLADMPGYGYAKRAKTTRSSWEKMTEEFFTQRENLVCVLQLIDSRIPPQKLDIEFTNKLGEWQVPFILVFTKCDKNSGNENFHAVKNYEKALSETWEEMPQHILTSAAHKIGKEDILNFIDDSNISYIKALKERD